MKLIYVAGPYTAEDTEGYEANIQRADDAMVQLLNRGWSVICPHKNGAWLHECKAVKDNTFEAWLLRDMAIINKCDAVFFLEGWHDSKGSCVEWGACLARDLPHFFQAAGYPVPGDVHID